MDTDSKLTLTPGDPKCHSHPSVGVGACESRVISRVLAKVQLPVDPPYLVRSSLYRVDILHNIPLVRYIDDIMLISQDEQQELAH